MSAFLQAKCHQFAYFVYDSHDVVRDMNFGHITITVVFTGIVFGSFLGYHLLHLKTVELWKPGNRE